MGPTNPWLPHMANSIIKGVPKNDSGTPIKAPSIMIMYQVHFAYTCLQIFFFFKKESI